MYGRLLQLRWPLWKLSYDEFLAYGLSVPASRDSSMHTQQGGHGFCGGTIIVFVTQNVIGLVKSGQTNKLGYI